MADLTFATPEGQTIDRELLIAYLNTGSKEAPTWSAIGKRVEDSSEDMMIGHFYATSGEAKFAERYDSCAIAVTGIGGDGGGTLNITSEITYGGNRTLGTITKDTSGVTFTAGA